MAALGTFLNKSRRQEARHNAADDDNCFPTYQVYQPHAQTMPSPTLLVQLSCEAAGLRCRLSAVEAQISQLVMALPTRSVGAPASAGTPPRGLRHPETCALEVIAARKVGNKKMVRNTGRKADAPKSATTKLDQWLVRFQQLHLVNSGDLGRRLLEHRAVAYAQGSGPNDSGSTSSGSECGTECDSESGDVRILCREPALHTCPSGCGSFCQTSYEAHEYDGRHWCFEPLGDCYGSSE